MQPAELAGYGPIDDELARVITACGVWQRLLTDPATGTVTDVGRRRYRPPPGLADLVRARDRVCAFPTCEKSAADCDLDHRRRWAAGGRTSAANLWPLCARHHAVKDGDHGWSCEVRGDGRVAWTTPAGRSYVIDRGRGDGASYVDVIDPAPVREPPGTIRVEAAAPF